jgi:hypothetical protein
MKRQSHIVSFIMQRPGQSVTCEMALAARTPPRRSWLSAEPDARQVVWKLLTGRTNGLML